MSGILSRLVRRTLRLFPEVAGLEAANRRLDEQQQRLTAERDTLTAERDTLAAHGRRLTGELEESHGREIALRAAVESGQQEARRIEHQRDALAAERDEQAAHARRLKENVEKLESDRLADRQAYDADREKMQASLDELGKRWVEDVQQWQADQQKLQEEIAGYQRLVGDPESRFYSPIIDVNDPHVRAVCARERERIGDECPGIHFNEPAMLEMFHRIARHYPNLDFPREKEAGSRYCFANSFFSYADAITLFGMLLELRPSRLVEAGSGHSSCAAMDTNDRHLGGVIDLRFFDPHPEALLALLEPDDPYRDHVFRSCLQDIPLETFAALEANDILFIDSSHVSKMASDVNDYLFRILPALKPGVVVHVHDVLYPFEYPASWVFEHHRSWNEAYLMRAFLQYNDVFEVIYFNDFIYNRNRTLTAEKMPLCLENTGGSIWLRKVK